MNRLAAPMAAGANFGTLGVQSAQMLTTPAEEFYITLRPNGDDRG